MQAYEGFAAVQNRLQMRGSVKTHSAQKGSKGVYLQQSVPVAHKSKLSQRR